MKLLAVLVVVLLALIGLAPFWGDLGVLVYGSINWLGTLLSTGELGDGRAALRAAILIGGSVSVLSFLRVAIQDRAVDYLIAAVMFAFVAFVVFVMAGISTDGSARHSGDADGERSVVVGTDTRSVPRWYSRGNFEREMVKKVHETARAAARGDRVRAEALLDELELWARNGPTLIEYRGEYERLREEYNQTVQLLAAQAGRRPLTRARLPTDNGEDVRVLTADEIRETELKQVELLQQMWKASPSSTIVPMRLLAIDLKALAITSRWSAPAPLQGDGAAALEDQLRRIHATQEVLFAYAPVTERLWTAYASTMVDTDEELALGALVIAGMVERRQKADTSDAASFDVNAMLLGSDVLMLSHLLSATSEARMAILRARASLLSGAEEEPVNGTATAALTSAGAASAAPVVAGSIVPPPEAPTAPSRESAMEAQRALPPAGLLVERKGLALRRPVDWPVPAPPAERGQVQVDLPAAGFRDGLPGILLREPGVETDTQVVLIVDVWQDGRVTSVLVEQGSGNAALDQAARDGARGWRSAGKVPKGGERRRVTVEFKAPVAAPAAVQEAAPVYPVGVTPPPPQLQPEQALGAQLSAMARRHPPRYPREAGGAMQGGRVELSITMSAAGRVLAVAVEESSGQPALDRAAREAALQWHVVPVRPVTSVEQIRLRVPVNFQAE